MRKLAIALIAFAGWGCADRLDPPVDSPDTVDEQRGGGAHATDSVIVKYRGAPQGLTALGGATVRSFTHLGKGELAVVQLAKGTSVDDALARLRRDPSVVYAEPNYTLYAQRTPDDPRFAEQWGLHNTGQGGGTADADIDAPEAWELQLGNGEIVVGVVDSGVDYSHPDLAANMWRNPREIAGNRVDDDGNGVIDDVHGVNVITDSGDPMDDNGHGTHVAGILGAVGNNGTGISGVAWQTSIMALKFLSASGSGSTADAIAALDYAVAQRQAGVNLRVLNNSWGGGPFSQALLEAIQATSDAGILFVATAGGSASNIDVTPVYPASYDVPNIIVATATDRRDQLASFASFGPTSVDLAAPGVDILSTVRGGYQVFSGTSMATAYVSGAAALALSMDETLSVDDLKLLLMVTGDAVPSLDGRIVSGRRLNVGNALLAIAPPDHRFGVSVDPQRILLVQGDQAQAGIRVSAVGAFRGDVQLAVSSAPPIAAVISPAIVQAPGDAALQITTDCATATGEYPLTITATSGGETHTAEVVVEVLPGSTRLASYSSADTPIAIPDFSVPGAASTITIADDAAIAGLLVEVDITHSYIGDLHLELTGPGGDSYVLHSLEGDDLDDLHQTYRVDGLEGQPLAGAWRLDVYDLNLLDTGTLDSWAIHAATAGRPAPPTASFTYTQRGRSVAFAGGGTGGACGVSIVGYAWDLGDGTTSTEQSPTHAYTAAGTFPVTLTVTASSGLTASATQTVTITRSAPQLSIESVSRVRGDFEFRVELRWTGAEGRLVDLYRNRQLVDIPDNDGALSDVFRRYDTTYTWKLCERSVVPGALCSNEVSVVFGPRGEVLEVVQ